MAFIRIVRPYQPVDPELFVDLGPSTGRRTHTRGSVYGGELVVPGKPQPAPVAATTPARRAQMAEYKKKARPCGRWIILSRSECARTYGHRDSCTSAARLARLAERRRAS